VQTAFSTESSRTYRLDRLIGKGGFGEVYLATPTPRGGLPEQVCIKITERLSSWLREAYFAELLFREPRALRVYDRFAEVENGTARYCIALEYAVYGDLSVWLEKKGAQSERFVRREIAAILQPLDILHRGQALHRDLTPFNVFVCEDEQLKLGDFGIAMHQRSQRGVTADAFNVFNHPNFIYLNSTVNFAGSYPNGETIANAPYNSAGVLTNQNGFGAVAAPTGTSNTNGAGNPSVANPRILQLVVRFQF